MMKQIILFIILFSIVFGTTSCKRIVEFSSQQKVEKLSEGKFSLTNEKNVKIPKFSKKSQTVIYLVRHAEKEKTKGDVHLTNTGKTRANNLKSILIDEQLDMVFSTRFNRTQETAEPSATAHQLNIQEYDPGRLESFGQSILDNHQGKKILVVGHSNTTPKLLNFFMGEEVKGMIDESDYENLYVISISKKGNAKALLLKY